MVDRYETTELLVLLGTQGQAREDTGQGGGGTAAGRTDAVTVVSLPVKAASPRPVPEAGRGRTGAGET